MNSNSMKKVSSDWIEVQTKVFFNWLNTQLERSDDDIQVSDIGDFKTGLPFLKFIESVDHEVKLRYTNRSGLQVRMLENIGVALNYFEKKGIRMVNIDAKDIYDGNLKLVLGILWTLIQHYQFLGSSGANKGDLIKWLNTKISGINNLTDDWVDGIALWTLVTALSPGILGDQPDTALDILGEAIQAATEYFDIPALLAPEDIISSPDEKSMMTYLSYFQDYSTRQDKISAASASGKVFVVDKNTSSLEAKQLVVTAKKDPVTNLKLKLANLQNKEKAVQGSKIILRAFRKQLCNAVSDFSLIQPAVEIVDVLLADLNNMTLRDNLIFELGTRINKLSKHIKGDLRQMISDAITTDKDITRAAIVAAVQAMGEIDIEEAEEDQLLIAVETVGSLMEDIRIGVPLFDGLNRNQISQLIDEINLEINGFSASPKSSAQNIQRCLGDILDIIYIEDTLLSVEAKSVAKETLSESLGQLDNLTENDKAQLVMESIAQLSDLTQNCSLAKREEISFKLEQLKKTGDSKAQDEIISLMEEIELESQFVNKKISNSLLSSLLAKQIKIVLGDVSDIDTCILSHIDEFILLATQVVSIPELKQDALKKSITSAESFRSAMGDIMDIVLASDDLEHRHSDYQTPTQFVQHISSLMTETVELFYDKNRESMIPNILKTISDSFEHWSASLNQSQFSSLTDGILADIESIKNSDNPLEIFRELLVMIEDLDTLVITDIKDVGQNAISHILVQHQAAMFTDNVEEKERIDNMLVSGLEETLLTSASKEAIKLALDIIRGLLALGGHKQNIMDLYDLISHKLNQGVSIREFGFRMITILNIACGGAKRQEPASLITRKISSEIISLICKLKILWTDTEENFQKYEDFLDELIHLFAVLPKNYRETRKTITTRIKEFLSDVGVTDFDNITLEDFENIPSQTQIVMINLLWILSDTCLGKITKDSSVYEVIPGTLEKSLNLFKLSAVSNTVPNQPQSIRVLNQLALLSKNFSDDKIDELLIALDKFSKIEHNDTEVFDIGRSIIDASLVLMKEVAEVDDSDIGGVLSASILTYFHLLRKVAEDCKDPKVKTMVIELRSHLENLTKSPKNNARRIIQSFYSLQESMNIEEGITPSITINAIIVSMQYLIEFGKNSNSLDAVSVLLTDYISTLADFNEELHSLPTDKIDSLNGAISAQDWETALSVISAF
eukprot:TRINITY_DN3514_c0_g1_i1.p1 TRINITY_DN3514_c0_g1~~TRINITY_DN3514_c0_g1_i1.p1  ORF type:complete len:1193 (+),score=311.68 TRINITY_DN3514_c0_g1_i1:157-3735(+)